MPKRYRTYMTLFKAQVVEEFSTGNWPVGALASKYYLDHRIVRIWVEKNRAGEYAGASQEGDLSGDYGDRIADLKRKVGQLVTENELLKKRLEVASRRSGPRPRIPHHQRPTGLTVVGGCRMIGLPRFLD